MNDTSPEMARKHREMLLQHSGAERLKMGCSMHATARALVRASVLAQDPVASPAALRRALFLRFYGHEFDAEERVRIAAWLGRDEPEPHGSARKVPVNWDDLEMALTANAEEWTCYLDTPSGDVHMVPVGGMDDDDGSLSEEELNAGLAARHLIHVEPLGSRIEYGWMDGGVRRNGERRPAARRGAGVAGRARDRADDRTASEAARPGPTGSDVMLRPPGRLTCQVGAD